MFMQNKHGMQLCVCVKGMVFTRPGGSFVSMKESNFQVMVAHGYA